MCYPVLTISHFVHGPAEFQKGRISFGFASPFSTASQREILLCLFNL